MSLSLLDYHSLEDGELNRLWYEENDPRARDAFRQRWWIGQPENGLLPDPIAGKDLIAEYHTLFMHRCFERGVLAEEHQLEVFKRATTLLVDEFPSEPIPKFEDTWLPFVDRAIDEKLQTLAPRPARSDAEDRAAIEAALEEIERSELLRAFSAGEAIPDEDGDALLKAARELLERLDGDAAANHPLVRTDEPPPSKLDESVAVPHFGSSPLFRYAQAGGSLGKREDAHIEWCQPCRERCVGALLLLRRLRAALGGEPPPLPPVSPEFTQILHKQDLGIPKVDRSNATEDRGTKKSRTGIVVAVVVAIAAVAAVAMSLA